MDSIKVESCSIEQAGALALTKTGIASNNFRIRAKWNLICRYR